MRNAIVMVRSKMLTENHVISAQLCLCFTVLHRMLYCEKAGAFSVETSAIVEHTRSGIGSPVRVGRTWAAQRN
jgi:uncharacterized membrane-anchored protein